MHSRNPAFGIVALASLLLLVSRTPRALADQQQQGPIEGLYAGGLTPHTFHNLPRVAGSVTVELLCRADLGCDGWDWTDCNTTTNACDVDPETKWVTLRIAGVTIYGTLPYIGVPNPGDPAVPTDGLFFRPWHYNSMDPAYAYCGISDCAGTQATNIHRLTVTQDQWNTWVTAGSGTLSIQVTSSSATMNLPTYCNLHALGDYCCDAQNDPPGECSHRPGSNATVRINYWPSGRCCHSDDTCTETSQANCTATGDVWTAGQTCGAGVCLTGSCCDPLTGDCSVTNEATCDAQCGAWSPGGSCLPNLCTVAAMGGCCYGSGLCILDTQVHCTCVGGSYSGDNSACEPNPCAQPPIIYVDVDAVGANDGTSWTNAYNSLQAALTAAAASQGADQIWVAQGTYQPSLPSGRDATFQMLNNVAIYGGFSGVETSESQRNPSQHPTMLSGVRSGGNVYHVVTGGSTDQTAIMDGFVITGGDHSDVNGGSGGGLYIDHGSPTIRNCVFTANLARNGGAAYLYAGSPTFVNCVFDDNQCTGTSGHGGAVALHGGDMCSMVALSNCTFANNRATGASGVGGGLANTQAGAGTLVTVVTNCIFWRNTAGGFPQQVSNEGAAVSVTYSDVQGGYTGTGNTDVYPQFLTAFIGADGVWGTTDDTYSDLHLASDSPCIDAGANAADVDASVPGIQPLPSVDGDLHARRMDDYLTEDASVGDCPVVDLGAYEFRRLCQPEACVRGDGNGDGLINGLDIQPLVDCLLGPAPGCNCPCDDMDLDGFVAEDRDVPCFVAVLLGESDCRVDCGQTGWSPRQDCNLNNVSDTSDIACGASEDCNHNFIPDEGDIDPNDPDGDGLVSDDDNENGVPDECEPDCNSNGIPDDKDIKDETSNDVNGNDIPDECEPDCNANTIPDAWDISQQTSADCNQNGTPDECEPDCNTNGVPDDCDIDPSDPDGDEWVSPDCNESGSPDECDIALGPPFGSMDCNDNGVPDECDLANCQYDPWCGDCNANGILDECDILAELSLDANENGIPDECEGDGLLGGGEQMMGGEGFGGGYLDGGLGGPCGGLVPEEWHGDPACAAAWGEFFDWSMQQTWGPASGRTGAEQLQRTLAKLAELGLPNPWHP